jgi:sugar phosphate isomerase/epimerase
VSKVCLPPQYVELGCGSIDFPTIFAELKKAGYSGAIVVESDMHVVPTMLESNLISRNYLRTILAFKRIIFNEQDKWPALLANWL